MQAKKESLERLSKKSNNKLASARDHDLAWLLTAFGEQEIFHIGTILCIFRFLSRDV
jgi:hypothetical protein